MVRFPPLADPVKDFCHFPRGCWYSSSTLPPKDGDRILLVRPGSIGDVLLLTPIIKKLKTTYPNCKVEVATIHDKILKNNPHITKIMKLENKTYAGLGIFGYDKVYWMSYEFMPEMHIVHSYAQIVGIEIIDLQPDYYIHQHELNESTKYLKQAGIDQDFICIHREVLWQTRKWDNKNWQELVNTIAKRFKVLDIQEGREESLKNTIRITGLDIRQVAAILKLSKALICVDSGLMHLGTALDIPVISLFGVTNPNYRLPLKYLQDSFYCWQHMNAGVHHKSLPPAEFEPQINDNPMDYISAESVYRKFGYKI